MKYKLLFVILLAMLIILLLAKLPDYIMFIKTVPNKNKTLSIKDENLYDNDTNIKNPSSSDDGQDDKVDNMASSSYHTLSLPGMESI